MSRPRGKRTVTASDWSRPTRFLRTVRLALREYGALSAASRFVAQLDGTRKFVRSASDIEDRKTRQELIRRFATIQNHITCAHAPFQFVLLAEHLLSLNVPGDMVLCGTYKGGSAAKLSLLAERIGRRLFVCDSFQGLPESAESGETKQGFGRRSNYRFTAGEYAGSQEEVRENIRRYGCLEVCRFVPGWFAESLPDLPVTPAFVFIDVDYISSARDCLIALWPRLVPGGSWFTHEASLIDYVEGILDERFWQDTFGACPPIMMGAGCGLSPAAPSLGYFRKSTR